MKYTFSKALPSISIGVLLLSSTAFALDSEGDEKFSRKATVNFLPPEVWLSIFRYIADDEKPEGLKRDASGIIENSAHWSARISLVNKAFKKRVQSSFGKVGEFTINLGPFLKEGKLPSLPFWDNPFFDKLKNLTLSYTPSAPAVEKPFEIESLLSALKRPNSSLMGIKIKWHGAVVSPLNQLISFVISKPSLHSFELSYLPFVIPLHPYLDFRIGDLGSIQKLKLVSPHIVRQNLNFQSLTNLRELTLDKFTSSPCCFFQLDDISQLTQLEAFSLSGFNLKSPQSSFSLHSSIAQLTNLKTLNLKAPTSPNAGLTEDITEEEMKTLISSHPTLQTLHLENFYFRGQALSSINSLTQLKELFLHNSYTDFSYYDSFLRGISSLTKLEKLTFSYEAGTDLPTQNSPKKPYLSRSFVDALKTLPNLNILNLRGLTWLEKVNLFPLKENPSLKEITLTIPVKYLLYASVSKISEFIAYYMLQIKEGLSSKQVQFYPPLKPQLEDMSLSKTQDIKDAKKDLESFKTKRNTQKEEFENAYKAYIQKKGKILKVDEDVSAIQKKYEAIIKSLEPFLSETKQNEASGSPPPPSLSDQIIFFAKQQEEIECLQKALNEIRQQEYYFSNLNSSLKR